MQGRDEKDLVIARLKEDLDELRNNEQDANELTLHYNALSHKLALLLDEKNRLENDYRQRNEASLKSALSLNQEFDRLKAEISRENLRIQELKAKNDEMRQSHEAKSGDIMSAQADLGGWQEKLRRLREERAMLNVKIREANEEKARNLQSVDDLRGRFSQLTKRNKELNLSLEELSAKREKLNEKGAVLAQSEQEKRAVLKKKEAILRKLREKHEQIQGEAGSLERDIEAVQGGIEQSRVEIQQNQRVYQEEVRKEDELNEAIRTLGGKMKIQDDFLGEIKAILTEIQRNNEELYENNAKIMRKIERFQDELSQHKDVKLQLTGLLMEYSEKVDKARVLLSRKDRFNEKALSSIQRIKASAQGIERIIAKYDSI